MHRDLTASLGLSYNRLPQKHCNTTEKFRKLPGHTVKSLGIVYGAIPCPSLGGKPQILLSALGGKKGQRNKSLEGKMGEPGQAKEKKQPSSMHNVLLLGELLWLPRELHSDPFSGMSCREECLGPQ